MISELKYQDNTTSLLNTKQLIRPHSKEQCFIRNARILIKNFNDARKSSLEFTDRKKSNLHEKINIQEKNNEEGKIDFPEKIAKSPELSRELYNKTLQKFSTLLRERESLKILEKSPNSSKAFRNHTRMKTRNPSIILSNNSFDKKDSQIMNSKKTVENRRKAKSTQKTRHSIQNSVVSTRFLVGDYNLYPFQGICENLGESKKFGKNSENRNLCWEENKFKANFMNRSGNVSKILPLDLNDTDQKIKGKGVSRYGRKKGITEWKTDLERTILSGNNKNYKNVITNRPNAFQIKTGSITKYLDKMNNKV